MRALRCRPGKGWDEIEIDNTLEALQAEVGGYIETLTIFTDGTFIMDEEGRLKDKTHCCTVLGVDMVGTVLFVGMDGDEFCDAPAGLTPQMMEGAFK